MNVLGEIKLFSKLKKSEFPVHMEKLETWGWTIEEIVKAWKSLNSFFCDITLIFDSYGNSVCKSGKYLQVYISKYLTQNNKHLGENLKYFGNFAENLGGVYSHSAKALNGSIQKKMEQRIEELKAYKKWMLEEAQNRMKEYTQTKQEYEKAKSKYNRSRKELESSVNALNKLQHEADKNFQTGNIQKYKERIKNCKNNLQATEKSLEELGTSLQNKHEALEDQLASTHDTLISLEKETLQGLIDMHYSVVNMNKNVLALRKEQSNLKNKQVEEFGNITLDMLTKDSDRGSSLQGIELINYFVEKRISSTDERVRILKIFKNYLSEIVATEENLARSIEKLVNNMNFPDYIKDKPKSREALNIFCQNFLALSQLHLKYASEIDESGLSPIQKIIKTQGDQTNSLQASIQKITKEFSTTQEEIAKEYSKKRNESQDLKEKVNSALLNTEHYSFSQIAENSNQEAAQLQILKVALTNLYKADEEAYTCMEEQLEMSIDNLEPINVEEDFQGIQTYQRQEIQEDFQQFKESSRAYEEPEEEETKQSNGFYSKFGIKGEVEEVERFSCAYSDKILLQGRMYVTTSHICFHSIFNSSTIIGRETRLAIPLSEVVDIEKRGTALIFDNAIGIVTQNSTFVFTSFIYRDQAFATIQGLLKINEAKSPSKLKFECEVNFEIRENRMKLSKLMKEAKTQESFENNNMVQSELLKHHLLDLEVNVPVEKVFQLFFNSKEFFTSFSHARGDTNIEIENWSPEPPAFFTDQEGDYWVNASTRTASYTHPVRGGMPMMPKTCLCKENQTVFFISKNEFVVEVKAQVEGVPYSDYFQAIVRYRVTGDQKSSVEVRYGMEFFKQSMFVKKIESSGVAECNETVNKIWAPMVTKEVQKSLGEKVEDTPPPKEEPQPKVSVAWVLSIVLVVAILAMWWKIVSLENRILKLESKNN